MSLFPKIALTKYSKFPLAKNSKSIVIGYIGKDYLFNIYNVSMQFTSFGKINIKFIIILVEPTQDALMAMTIMIGFMAACHSESCSFFSQESKDGYGNSS